MPRAKSDDSKSSAELNAEIKELREQIAAKQKLSREAKQREDRAAAEAKQYEDFRNATAFVDMCKQIYLEDHRDMTGTIYDLVWPVLMSDDASDYKRVVRPDVIVHDQNGEPVRVTEFTKNADGEIVPVTDDADD